MNATRFSFEGYPWEYCYKSRWISWHENWKVLSSYLNNFFFPPLYVCPSTPSFSLSLSHTHTLFPSFCSCSFIWLFLFAPILTVRWFFVKQFKRVVKESLCDTQVCTEQQLCGSQPCFCGPWLSGETILDFARFYSAELEVPNQSLVHMWCIHLVLFNQMWPYM